MSTYRIKVAGMEYTGQYASSCTAVIVALAIYGTHSVSARKVSP